MKALHREPVAIVGIGCRLPGGVESAQALWELLCAKQSAICDVPADRWDAEALYHPDFRKPGHIHVRRGGFLSHIDRFDALGGSDRALAQAARSVGAR